jgi:Flp pilus assembly protein TadD
LLLLSVDVAVASADSEAPKAAPAEPTVDLFALHAAKGFAAYQNGQFADAARELEQAVALTPDPRLVGLLATSYAETGRLDDAVTQYERVLVAEPNNAIARRALGMVYIRRGDLLPAVIQLKKAVESSPDDPEMHVALGKGYYLAGSSEAARQEFDKVIEKVPNHPDAHAGIGACLHVTGQFEPALREYLRALQLGYDRNVLYAALLSALQSYSTAADAAPFAKQALTYYPANSELQTLSGAASH